MKSRSLGHLSLMFLASPLLVGCGNSSSPVPVHPVAGTILAAGRPYAVLVRPGAGPSLEDGDGKPARVAPITPALVKYAEVKTSPLKATVKPGENRHDFTL